MAWPPVPTQSPKAEPYGNMSGAASCMVGFGSAWVFSVGGQRSTKGSATTGADSCVLGSGSALVSIVSGERSTKVSATMVPSFFHSRVPMSSARPTMPIRAVGTQLYSAIRCLSKLPTSSPSRLIPKSPDSSFHTQGEQEKNAPNQSSCVCHGTALSPKRTPADSNKKLDATKPFLARAAIARPRIRF
jgi:hypothetical protein